MYYDDNYHPADANDYDGDSSSVSASTSGGDSENRRLRKIREDYKKADPCYSKIKRVMEIDGGKKKVSVEIYRTPVHPGATIRNAMTGLFETGEKVGTSDEDHYFSVILATGETGQNSAVLFYDSPQQYERHFGCKLSTDIKSKWANKNLAARLSRDKERK
jgi:hypothetical protein